MTEAPARNDDAGEIRAIRGAMPPTAMVYEYGVRLDEAIDGQEALIERQYMLAHRLYNEVVAHSREVLSGCVRILEEKNGRLTEIARLLDGLYESRRGARATDARDRFAALTVEIQKLRRERWSLLHEERKKHRDLLAPLLEEVRTTRATSVVYQIRKRYVEEGLYWASANAVLQAFARAWQKQWPRFAEVNFRQLSARTSFVLVDQVNDSPGGITQDELFSGRYRLFLGPVMPSQRGGKRVIRSLRFRAGPNGQNVLGTVLWHRELPKGARITEARLVIRRVARQRRYYLQLQLALPPAAFSEDAVPQRADARRIAGISLGWYKDGDTRRIGAVCEVADPASAEVLRFPVDILDDLERVEELQSQRDQWRDEIVGWLRESIAEIRTADVEENLRELLRLPSSHIAPARLASVIGYWRDVCVDQERTVFDRLEAWRKKDAKEWERLSHIRRRALARRRKHYQQLASQWVEKYHTIMLFDLDLKTLARIKDEETGEHTDLGGKARHGRQSVALYELERSIENAASRQGTIVVRVSDKIIGTCAICATETDAVRKAIIGRCEHCGEEIERRANGAANLVRFFDTHKIEIETAAENAVRESESVLAKRAEMKKKRSAARSAAAKARRDDGVDPENKS